MGLIKLFNKRRLCPRCMHEKKAITKTNNSCLFTHSTANTHRCCSKGFVITQRAVVKVSELHLCMRRQCCVHLELQRRRMDKKTEGHRHENELTFGRGFAGLQCNPPTNLKFGRNGRGYSKSQ